MDFETYLTSKKIDSVAFRNAEPDLWSDWNSEFDQMHPDSFTVQKLNLINPIRRKYTLKIITPIKPQPSPPTAPSTSAPQVDENQPASASPAKPKPVMAKPVFKPKPKM